MNGGRQNTKCSTETYFYFIIDSQILMHALTMDNNSIMLFFFIMFTRDPLKNKMLHLRGLVWWI